MAAGYSKTALAKKLGLRPGARLLLLGAPRGWEIADLPEGVRTTRRSLKALGDAPPETVTAAETIIAFFEALASMQAAIPLLGRRIFPDGAIWVAWPRRAGGHESDIREQDIRDLALPLGLVDVKVAALDEDWSGLRLVWRRERRQTSQGTPG
jgi:hypothetical protein